MNTVRICLGFILLFLCLAALIYLFCFMPVGDFSPEFKNAIKLFGGLTK